MVRYKSYKIKVNVDDRIHDEESLKMVLDDAKRDELYYTEEIRKLLKSDKSNEEDFNENFNVLMCALWEASIDGHIYNLMYRDVIGSGCSLVKRVWAREERKLLRAEEKRINKLRKR